MEFDFKMATKVWLDRLENAMWETVAGIADTDIFVADDRESLRRHLWDEGRIVMALAKAEVTGFLMVRFPAGAPDNLGTYAGLSSDEMSFVAHMESVAVRPAYRGHGLQRWLVEQGEALAKTLGFKYSMCTVAPHNPWSLANMQAAGYSIVATVPKYGGRLRHILFKAL